MMGKKITLMLLVLLALSLPVGAAVISVNVESQKTGEVYIARFGDITGSYVTGTQTEWNVLNAGDSDGYAYAATTGVLGTMDGSATSYDVKFTIAASEPAAKVGRLWAEKDYIFCQDGGSNIIDAYEFKYTGLVAGESYDLLFKCNRNYSQVTIDGVTIASDWDSKVATFNGVNADKSGVITGDIRENTDPSVTNQMDKLYWLQIKGNYDAMGGTPSGGELVSSAVDTLLSWTNLVNPDPNAGPDVYVEVYCEQILDPNVLVASGTGISSATVDTTALGDFYWRVDSYLDYVDDNNKGPVTSGFVYYFISVYDMPVSSVDAGVDIISWSGQPTWLLVNVVDDGKSGLTYAWSVDPNSGVVLTEVPNDGDDLSSNIKSPNVTITKVTDNPSTVTLTVAVNDAGNPEIILEDSMTIDVYDSACKAAAAVGQLSTSDLDGDCVTNLTDLAIMAETWLIDTKISGPVLK